MRASLPSRYRGAGRFCGYAFVLLVPLAACASAPDHVEVDDEVGAALEECQVAVDKLDCYQPRVLGVLGTAGVGPALEVLEGIASTDADVERDAHQYAHAIGVNAYVPGEPFTEVFAQCSELFQSGCYHGVIQAYFVDRGVDDAATVRGLCTPYASDEQRWLFFQCLHGLGHALTMLYDHRLPDALEGCDLLGSEWDRESCYGGAFMENVVSVTQPRHPASELAHDRASADAGGSDAWEPLRASDPQYPCSVLAERYSRACYVMQTSAMLWLNGWDVAATAERCGEAPERWRATCFQSLGRDLSSLTLQDPEESLRQCGNAPDEYREWCYVGLVKNFVDLTATTEAGFDFCRRVEEFAKPRCNEALGEEIWNLHASSEARREACAPAETPELRLACSRGARVGGG